MVIVARLSSGLTKKYKNTMTSIVMENFVALNTILLTYSLTELVNGYGFLAVFVAGLVVQHSYKTQNHWKI